MLYDDYYKALVVYAMKFVTDITASEDIVQEMFSRLYERKPEFDSIYSLRSYIYNMVRNLSLDWLRHKKVEDAYLKNVVQKTEVYSLAETGEEEMFDEEVYRQLADFFNKLPPRQHEIILLAIEGKKNMEIAEILGVKVGTVKTQKMRALHTLRKNFDADVYAVMSLWLLT